VTEAEAKYKALKLAIECRAARETPQDTVERAGSFYAFIGCDKAESPAAPRAKTTKSGQV